MYWLDEGINTFGSDTTNQIVFPSGKISLNAGVLRFLIDGEEDRIITLVGGERMFIIVGDLTNQDETYQAGRYLYVDIPAEGEVITTIDFNKMYNPLCAYSAFTTCQLPPKENRLDVRIEAGDLRPQPEYGPEVIYY